MFNHPLALELAYGAVEESIRLGASFADARYELNQHEILETRQGLVDRLLASADRGIGVRVLVRGAWGFAAVSEPSRHDVTVAARRAVDMARAAAVFLERPVQFTSQAPHRSTFRTPIKRDPLAVPIEDKVDLAMSIDERLRSRARVSDAGVRLCANRTHKVYVNSEGSEVDQELVWTGGRCRLAVTVGDDFHVRAFPRGEFGAIASKGWEFIAELDLMKCAEQMALEAQDLGSADACPSERTTVILDADAAADLVHHTCGYAFELDRALGWCRAEGGLSNFPGERLGRSKMGSPIVSVYADATAEGAAGSFGFDDEGVEAQRIDLVTEGRHTGYLAGRDSASVIGLERSSGAMRAASWEHFPMVRVTNIALSPGSSGDLEALIADTRSAVLIEGPQAFSLDERGELFVAVAETGWVIKNGRRAHRVHYPSYRGSTTDFWGRCDAIGDAGSWAWFGALDGLGKGLPSQRLVFGRGAAPARFVGVDVGPPSTGRRASATSASLRPTGKTPQRRQTSRKPRKKSRR